MYAVIYIYKIKAYKILFIFSNQWLHTLTITYVRHFFPIGNVLLSKYWVYVMEIERFEAFVQLISGLSKKLVGFDFVILGGW